MAPSAAYAWRSSMSRKTFMCIFMLSALNWASSASDCSSVAGVYDFHDEGFFERSPLVLAEGTTELKQQYQKYKTGPVSITSSADCCAACKRNPQCNAWIYCGQKEGCGRCPGSVYGCSKGGPLRPRNFCSLRQSKRYLQFKLLKPDGPADYQTFRSGKISSRAPTEKEKHPPVAPDAWKCSVSYSCAQGSPEYIKQYCGDNKPTCAAASCHAVHGLYDTPKSQILEPDTNSHGITGGLNHPPKVATPAACCQACAALKGCNLWNYCWDPLGCGIPGSCNYSSTNFPVTSKAYERGHIGEYSTLKCTPDGRFPQYTCQLRQASNYKAKPKGPFNYYSWTSGKLK